MNIDAFYAAFPPNTFRELGANLFFSITFNVVHSSTNKSTEINVLEVVGWVILAKAIEASMVASFKLTGDCFTATMANLWQL